MTHKPTDSLMAAINKTIEGWKVGDYVDMSDVITILTDCRTRLSTCPGEAQQSRERGEAGEGSDE